VIDAKGRLIFCEVDRRAIVQREADGTESILADHCRGQALNAPNDLWLAPDGCIYFTLPKLRAAKAKKDGVPENVLNGTLVRISANRKIIENVGAAVGVEQPNGVVGSADGKRIWWTDGSVCKTATIRIDGSLSDPKVAANQGSDGLAVDEKGNLYTVTKTGLTVYGPDGKELGQIAVPESPSNMKFGGKDGRTLFITARTGVYVADMKLRGEGFAK
jgi:gluconolactonase